MSRRASASATRRLLLVRLGGNASVVRRAAERAGASSVTTAEVDASDLGSACARPSRAGAAVVRRRHAARRAGATLWSAVTRVAAERGGAMPRDDRARRRAMHPARGAIERRSAESMRGMMTELHAPGSRVVERLPHRAAGRRAVRRRRSVVARHPARRSIPIGVLNPGILGRRRVTSPTRSRRALRASPARRSPTRARASMRACTAASACRPVRRISALEDENDSPRGRIVLMRALVEGTLAVDDPDVRTHIDRCLGCRACETACPSGVPYGQLLEATRATLTASAAQRADRARHALRLRASRAARARDARRARSRARCGCRRCSRACLDGSASRWRCSRRRARRSVATAYRPAGDGSRGSVALLDGCVMEGLFTETNRATERTLAVNDYAVVHDERSAMLRCAARARRRSRRGARARPRATSPRSRRAARTTSS